MLKINIMRMIKSREMSLAGNVARIGENNAYRVLMGNSE
jgi:hypothetical protein